MVRASVLLPWPPVCYLLSSPLQDPASLWMGAAHKPTCRYGADHCIDDGRLPSPTYILLLSLLFCQPSVDMLRGLNSSYRSIQAETRPGCDTYGLLEQSLGSQAVGRAVRGLFGLPAVTTMHNKNTETLQDLGDTWAGGTLALPPSTPVHLRPAPVCYCCVLPQAAVAVAEFVKRQLWEPSSKRLKRAFCKAPSAVEGEQA
jgi:hypothetical protein